MQRAFILSVLCVFALACTYDPAHDRKIPRPPKVLEWTYAAHFDAPPEQVWAVLVDFDSYASWNPWLPRAQGSAVVGGRVDVTYVLGERRRHMSHRVVSVEPPGRFCWRDTGATTGFATGMRCREIEPDGAGGTDFRVILTIGGAFRETVRKRYGERLQAAMEAETQALAREVERRQSAPPAP